MSEVARCELCGEPMPAGEEMFKIHGYSGPCPKPPLPKAGGVADAPPDTVRFYCNVLHVKGLDKLLQNEEDREKSLMENLGNTVSVRIADILTNISRQLGSFSILHMSFTPIPTGLDSTLLLVAILVKKTG